MNSLKYILTVFALLLIGCKADSVYVSDPEEGRIHRAEVRLGHRDMLTRATFDKDLKAEWEASDRLKIIQGYGSFASSDAGVLDFAEYGDIHSEAVFEGSVLVASPSSKYYHLTYPAGSSSLSVSDGTTTASLTIQSSQGGRWTPYMYSSVQSDEDGLSDLEAEFNAVNGALAIRVYEMCDFAEPKEIQRVTIRADKAIAGTCTLSASGNGPLGNPQFSSTSTSISSTNPQYVTDSGHSYYEYRFNVIPQENVMLEITLESVNDEEKTFETPSGIDFVAGKRTGLNITWDSPAITVANATSWYSAIASSEILSGSTVYAEDGDTELEGGTIYACDIDWSNVPSSATKGIIVDGTEHAGVFSLSGLSTGNHTIRAYARIGEKSFQSEESTVTVTPAVTASLGTLSSWYTESAGGQSSSTAGGTINIASGIVSSAATLSDIASYLSANPYSYRYTPYGGSEQTVAAAANTSGSITGITSDGNCSVRGCIVLKNGAKILTASRSVAVTKKFGVEFSAGALDSWYNDIEGSRSRAGNTLYITSTITSDANGEFAPEEKYYTYWKEGSVHKQTVVPSRSNTVLSQPVIRQNGGKIAESTTSVPITEGNGKYYVQAHALLPNGTVVSSETQSIDVTEVFTVSMTEDCTNSWYKSRGAIATGSRLYIQNSTITSTASGAYTPSSVYYSYNLSGSQETAINGPALNAAGSFEAATSSDGLYSVRAYAVLPNGKKIKSADQSLYVTQKFTINQPSVSSWYSSDDSGKAASTLYIDSSISAGSSAGFVPSTGYRLYRADGTLVSSHANTTASIGSLAQGDYYVVAYASYPNNGPEITSTFSSTIDVTPVFTVSMTADCTNSWYKSKGSIATGNRLYIQNSTVTSTASGTYAPTEVYYTYNIQGGNETSITGITLNSSTSKEVSTSSDGLYYVRACAVLPKGHRAAAKVIRSADQSLYVTQKFTITSATVSTWYSNTGKSAGSTIYIDGTSSSTLHDAFLSGATIRYEYSGGTISTSIGNTTLSKAVSNGDNSVVLKAYLPYDGPTISSAATAVYVTDKPDLSITVRSSYSSNGNASPSNSYDGSSIYFTGGKLVKSGTSTEIDSYSKGKLFSGSNNVQYYCNDSNTETYSNAFTDRTFGSLSWQQYNSYAQVTLNNGYVIKKSYTTHVTGIPADFNPPTEGAGWSKGSWNVKWESSYAQLGDVSGSGECSITYSRFHIPNNVSINVYTSYTAKSLYWLLSYQVTTYSVSIAGSSTDIYTTPRDKNEHSGTSNTAGTLTSSNKSIKLESSYKAAGPYVKVHQVKVTYR